jgi:carbamoyl-phosphate synthase small subunit
VTEAILVLEDGSAFRGRAFGARGEAFGEAVFNTAMTGYQEVLTDPSYAAQIVTLTVPHVGNYGVTPEDAQSDRVRAAGLVVRSLSLRASSWRAAGTLGRYLEAAGVPGVEGVDTRRLALRLREGGAMRAALSTEDLDPASLLARVRRSPRMEGADLAAAASTARPYPARQVVGPAAGSGRVFRVAAYDFGLKRGILRELARHGCEATVFPARTPPDRVLDGGFDGVVLSNGPGDPAATGYGIEAARRLLGRVPVLGVCLGHQLLSLALGGRTYKLRYGHRGANQPVRDAEAGRVLITSHNHGFAVDPRGWSGWRAWEARGWPPRAHRTGRLPEGGPPVVDTPFGRVALTHWNLSDGTLEGLPCLDVAALSIQFHPEAAPGPRDARPVFARFRELMG